MRTPQDPVGPFPEVKEPARRRVIGEVPALTRAGGRHGKGGPGREVLRLPVRRDALSGGRGGRGCRHTLVRVERHKLLHVPLRPKVGGIHGEIAKAALESAGIGGPGEVREEGKHGDVQVPILRARAVDDVEAVGARTVLEGLLMGRR